jgi:Domain of unknown function (DUF397)
VATDLSRALWYKSTFSNGSGGACVEVASNLPGIVAVRDSKDPNGPKLTTTKQAWSAFVQGIKATEFEL